MFDTEQSLDCMCDQLGFCKFRLRRIMSAHNVELLKLVEDVIPVLFAFVPDERDLVVLDFRSQAGDIAEACSHGKTMLWDTSFGWSWDIKNPAAFTYLLRLAMPGLDLSSVFVISHAVFRFVFVLRQRGNEDQTEQTEQQNTKNTVDV